MSLLTTKKVLHLKLKIPEHHGRTLSGIFNIPLRSSPCFHEVLDLVFARLIHNTSG